MSIHMKLHVLLCIWWHPHHLRSLHPTFLPLVRVDVHRNDARCSCLLAPHDYGQPHRSTSPHPHHTPSLHFCCVQDGTITWSGSVTYTGDSHHYNRSSLACCLVAKWIKRWTADIEVLGMQQIFLQCTQP